MPNPDEVTRYQPDHVGVAGLMVSAGVHRVMIDEAFDAIPFAKSISPPGSGGYINDFEVDGSHVERIARSKRAVAHLKNTSPHATSVELGWDIEHKQFADHRGYHVLSITADIVGTPK